MRGRTPRSNPNSRCASRTDADPCMRLLQIHWSMPTDICEVLQRSPGPRTPRLTPARSSATLTKAARVLRHRSMHGDRNLSLDPKEFH